MQRLKLLKGLPWELFSDGASIVPKGGKGTDTDEDDDGPWVVQEVPSRPPMRGAAAGAAAASSSSAARAADIEDARVQWWRYHRAASGREYYRPPRPGNPAGGSNSPEGPYAEANRRKKERKLQRALRQAEEMARDPAAADVLLAATDARRAAEQQVHLGRLTGDLAEEFGSDDEDDAA